MFRLHSVFEFSSLFISRYEEHSLVDVTIIQILSLRGPDLRTVMELHTGHYTLRKHFHRTVIYTGIPSVSFVDWQRELPAKLYMNVKQ